MAPWLSPLFLFTVVSALSPSPRDVNTVMTDLKTIDTQANAVTDSITKWDGSLLGATDIASASSDLNTVISDTTEKAKAETGLSNADSQKILTYVNGTLSPDTKASLDALISRQPDVASLGVESLVLEQVQTLNSSVSGLGATLVAISSADAKGSAQAVADSMGEAFDATIAAYS